MGRRGGGRAHRPWYVGQTVSRPDPRAPGLSFLAFLATPGLLVWSSWAYVLLAPSEASGHGPAIACAWPLGFVALAAGIPATYCRAPWPLRWGVAAIDFVAFLASAALCIVLSSAWALL